MSAPSLSDVVGNLNTLPSLPTVVAELLETMGRDDVDIDRIARGIGNDQALAARTLRVANSPFYGVSGHIDTIAEAITVLGFVNVRSLVTTAGIAAALPVEGVPGFEPAAFWRHSMETAVCAAALAERARHRPETLFLAGLLHDLGRLVLVARQPAPYAEAMKRRAREDCLPVEAERAVLGFDHAAVGAALCRHWRIPAPITLAVERHHDVEAGAGAANMTDLVHVADVLAHALDPADDPAALVPPPTPDAWRRLNLDPAMLDAVLMQATGQFRGMAIFLGDA